MAITNKQIIEMYRAEKNIPADVELYTFAAWKRLGFSVKKGEKSAHVVALWKYTEKKKKKDENGKEVQTGGYCVTRNMHLFTREQVESLKAK